MTWQNAAPFIVLEIQHSDGAWTTYDYPEDEGTYSGACPQRYYSDCNRDISWDSLRRAIKSAKENGREIRRHY